MSYMVEICLPKHTNTIGLQNHKEKKTGKNNDNQCIFGYFFHLWCDIDISSIQTVDNTTPIVFIQYLREKPLWHDTITCHMKAKVGLLDHVAAHYPSTRSVYSCIIQISRHHMAVYGVPTAPLYRTIETQCAIIQVLCKQLCQNIVHNRTIPFHDIKKTFNWQGCEISPVRHLWHALLKGKGQAQNGGIWI